MPPAEKKTMHLLKAVGELQKQTKSQVQRSSPGCTLQGLDWMLYSDQPQPDGGHSFKTSINSLACSLSNNAHFRQCT